VGLATFDPSGPPRLITSQTAMAAALMALVTATGWARCLLLVARVHSWSMVRALPLPRLRRALPKAAQVATAQAA
jgi:hypothetical protein